ncbi:unnamed protein product [Closterium sp. NIES-65]|nr:unnamed protein product [Closterium sp. NIES-65]
MEDITAVLPHSKKEPKVDLALLVVPSHAWNGHVPLSHSLSFSCLLSSPRYRHLMEDITALLPHSKKEPKVDVARGRQLNEALSELMDLRGCSLCLFFESLPRALYAQAQDLQLCLCHCQPSVFMPLPPIHWWCQPSLSFHLSPSISLLPSLSFHLSPSISVSLSLPDAQAERPIPVAKQGALGSFREVSRQCRYARSSYPWVCCSNVHA